VQKKNAQTHGMEGRPFREQREGEGSSIKEAGTFKKKKEEELEENGVRRRLWAIKGRGHQGGLASMRTGGRGTEGTKAEVGYTDAGLDQRAIAEETRKGQEASE